MKNVIALFLSLMVSVAVAQDPDVNGSVITGTSGPTPFLNGETVSFDITAGSGSGNLTWPAPGGAPFQISVTTGRIYNPQVTVTGSPGNYFTVTVTPVSMSNPVTYLIEIVQNQTIPDASFTIFTITGVATGLDGQVVGYSANGDPGGYNPTNTGNDTPEQAGTISGNLPVSLIDFTAVAEGPVAHLKWATSEESNSDHFEVQHSLDAKHWVTKGSVGASGDSKTIENYSFSDAEVANGNNYYRLKSVDKDGSFELSKMRLVFFEDIPEVSFEVYPNPTADRFTIKTPDWSKVRSVSVVNLNGREVFRSGSKPEREISLANLPHGIYTVKVVYANQSEITKRLAIQK